MLSRFLAPSAPVSGGHSRSGRRAGSPSRSRFRAAASLVVVLLAAAGLNLVPGSYQALSAQDSPAAICRAVSNDHQCDIPKCLAPNSASVAGEDSALQFVDCARSCGLGESRGPLGQCESDCLWPFVSMSNGGCTEVLDQNHPCVAAGRVPDEVTSNLELAGWVYLAGAGECVTHADYQNRMATLLEVSEAEAEAFDELRKVTVRFEAVEVELLALNKDLTQSRQRRADAETLAAEFLSEWEAASTEVMELQRQAEQEREILRDFAVAAYMDGNALGALAASTGSLDSVQAVGVSNDYAGSVLDHQDRLIRSVARLERAAAQREEKLAALTVAAVEAMNAVEAETEKIDASIAAVQARHAEQGELWDEANQVAEQLSENKAETEAFVGVLEASSDEIEQLLRENGAGASSPSQFDGSIYIPLEGLVNSSYGTRIHPFLGTSDFHRGVDIDSGFGEPIHAAVAGTVVIAGDQVGYGKTVVIDHGAGLSTLYAHQQSVAVSVGQFVEKGQIVGYTGSTGYSTGPHLHFEIRINGVHVDPAPYLSTIGR